MNEQQEQKQLGMFTGPKGATLEIAALEEKFFKHGQPLTSHELRTVFDAYKKSHQGWEQLFNGALDPLRAALHLPAGAKILAIRERILELVKALREIAARRQEHTSMTVPIAQESRRDVILSVGELAEAECADIARRALGSLWDGI